MLQSTVVGGLTVDCASSLWRGPRADRTTAPTRREQRPIQCRRPLL